MPTFVVRRTGRLLTEFRVEARNESAALRKARGLFAVADKDNLRLRAERA